MLHNHEQAIMKTYSKLIDQIDTVKSCQQINTDLDKQVKQIYKLILKISDDQAKTEQEETQRQCIIAEMLENILGGIIFNKNLMEQQEPKTNPEEQDLKDETDKLSQSPIHITIELTEDIQPKGRLEITFIRDYAYQLFKARTSKREDMTPNQYRSEQDDNSKSEKEMTHEDDSSSKEE